MALLNTYDSFMPMGSVNPVLQNIHELSSTAEHKIGDLLILADGRRFRYARSGAALAVGKGCAPVSTLVPEPAAVNAGSGVTYAIGTKTIAIDAVAATVPVNSLAGGFMSTADGYVYPIVGNTVVASNACTLFLGEGLRATLADNAVIQIAPSLWAGVNQTITTIANKCAGVPLVAATAAGQYLWVQTKGVTAGYMASDQDVAYGDALVLHTDGEFLPKTDSADAVATVPMICAYMAQAQASNTDGYYLIDLCCE